MAVRKAKKNEENRAVAFLNYRIPYDGRELRAKKGFPIFQNPQYPDKYQDILVKLAEKAGGSIELNLPVRITLNNGLDVDDIDIDKILVTPSKDDTASK